MERTLWQVSMEAMEAFREAPSEAALWTSLNRHLEPFGITGTLYGTECTLGPAPSFAHVLCSLPPDWLEAKMQADLFYEDHYVEVGRTADAPLLWSDTSALDALGPRQVAALAIDYDYNILTGVTLPVSFSGGLGRSAFGCHADGTSWAEFDRLWLTNQEAILRILLGFDLRFRSTFIPRARELDTAELDCLQRLAAGQPPKVIAHSMKISDARCRTLIRAACRKLEAANATQAVAMAVIFGFVTP